MLFVGSTKSISKPDAETVFVRQWVDAPARGAGQAVAQSRHPHPAAPVQLRPLGARRISAVSRTSRSSRVTRPIPVNEADRADYFDSLFHSAAVVGINTSAMIEAAIVGRTVHTLLDPVFSGTQEGTLHFRYLLPANGGFLHVAHSLDEHVAAAGGHARRSERRRAAARRLRSSLRPAARADDGGNAAAGRRARGARQARPSRVRARMPALRCTLLRAMLFLAGLVSAYRRPGSTAEGRPGTCASAGGETDVSAMRQAPRAVGGGPQTLTSHEHRFRVAVRSRPSAAARGSPRFATPPGTARTSRRATVSCS